MHTQNDDLESYMHACSPDIKVHAQREFDAIIRSTNSYDYYDPSLTYLNKSPCTSWGSIERYLLEGIGYSLIY